MRWLPWVGRARSREPAGVVIDATPVLTTGETLRWWKRQPMRYVNATMAPDETILAVGRFPRTYDVISVLWLLTLFGVPVFVARTIKKNTTELAVTSKRFVYKRGFVARRTEEFATNRIRHIQVTQSLLGRVFDYGRIHIEGSDIGAFGLPIIAKPILFRRALSISGGGTPEPAPARVSVSEKRKLRWVL